MKSPRYGKFETVSTARTPVDISKGFTLTWQERPRYNRFVSWIRRLLGLPSETVFTDFKIEAVDELEPVGGEWVYYVIG